jgi:hypothetical protein
MGTRHDITQLLRQGLSPLEIGKRLARGADIVKSVLLQVGEGDLRLSEVLFSIPRERQEKYEGIIRHLPGRGICSWQQSCTARRLDVSEFTLYALSRNSEQGDMYIHLRKLEVSLHHLVRVVLEHAFQTHDDAWWREGVPLPIRERCAQTKEADPEPMSELYAYTTCIDLKRIIDTHWRVFQPALPKAVSDDKKLFMKGLDRLNSIRNGVMHPVKPMEITREHFGFVLKILEALSAENWRIDEATTGPE